MRSFLPIAAVALLAVVVGLSTLAPWLRQADPEWIAHASADTASVVGRVIDEEGKPVPGAELVWYAETAEASGRAITAFMGATRTATDASGSFRFESLATDNGYVAVDSEKSNYVGGTGELRPRKGFDARLDVEVCALPTTRRLRGMLRTADGHPAEPRLVRVQASTWFTNWQGGVSSRADGGFEILLPWECDEVDVSWAPFDGSVPPSKPVRVRVRDVVTLRVDDPK